MQELPAVNAEKGGAKAFTGIFTTLEHPSAEVTTKVALYVPGME